MSSVTGGDFHYSEFNEECSISKFPQPCTFALREFLFFRPSTLRENCALLGYYAASSGNFLPTFRDSLTVPSGTP